jgi:Tol biopolymer transport system component
VLLNREGRETPVAAPPKAYVRARFSPSGDRLAIDVRELDADLWMWDVNREVLTRLTSTRSDERNAIWTPDGRQLVYASDAGGSNGLYRLAADGSGTAERLTTSTDIQAPLALSPDGRVVVLMQLKSGTINYELRSIEVDGNRTPRMLTQAPLIDPYVAISPDGRWMAYASLESGRSEVFVRRFPSGTDTPVRASTDGGSYPMWPRLGHELLYLDLQRRMMSADVRTGATFSASKARPLFAARYFTPPLGRAFDVTEDGRRFVMIKDSQANRQFVFVEHWLDEVVRQTR